MVSHKASLWSHKSKSDDQEVTEKLSQWILNPDFTEVIGLYFRPSLLEILEWSKKLVGVSSDSVFYKLAHSGFCVCLSKLISISDEVKKFILVYFKDTPPPFSAILLSSEEEQPLAKKCKASYKVSPVTDFEILQATLIFLNIFGSDEFKSWGCFQLSAFLKHNSEEIRWLTCNILALLNKMSEHDYRIFLDKYTSKDFQTHMLVLDKFSIAKPQIFQTNANLYLSEKNTFKVGKVLLSLHNSNAVIYDGLVELKSAKENLEAIALAISSNSPVLVEGVVGSGKTCLIEHIANMTGRSKSPELSKIQLSDQTDSKTLIGTYRCTPNPGEFIWQAGSLTQAVSEGHWLLLEDIDFAPIEVISLLIPILESRILAVPGHGNIRAHPNFQIFATRRILPAGCRMRIGSTKLIENLFTKVTLKNLSSEEIKSLISNKYPDLASVAEKLVEVYIALSYGQHGTQKAFEGCPQCSSKDLTSAKASGRFVSLRDLMKWCLRMMSHIDEVDLHLRAFEEALDCFCAAVPDVGKRYKFALHIGSHLNLNEPTVHFYFHKYKPGISNNSLTTFSIGSRGKIPRKRNSLSLKGGFKSMFSKTRLSSCLLEKLTVAVMNNEPVLIVGETGTGKTTTVQYLSQETNHSLRVINMNQQSDSTDLLGGFKPVEMRTVVSPLRQEFECLFSRTFSVKENRVFLSHIMTSFVNNNWKVLFSLMEETSKRACKKLNSEVGIKADNEVLIKQWRNFQFKMKSIKDQANKLQSALAFSFIEGTLVKAVLEGEWVLLDEINLASADTLECLSGLLESTTGSVTLHERGDIVPLVRHPEFRLFACMNPATDVGKKELPAGLRNRFTEFFMEEYEEKEDLIQLVQEYLQEHNPSAKLVSGIVSFYQKVREVSLTHLTDGTGHKPHFSLRTLCRALVVARRNPCKSFSRSLEEAFCLSFLTQLDRSSYPVVTALIDEKILFKKLDGSKKSKDKKTGSIIPCPGIGDDYVHVEGYWVHKGDVEPKNPEKYIMTSSVQNNLKDLVRIVSIGKFPILLQGDTSVGKTSLISYLAQLTGNTCFRINNHQHTDLQEYVGSYAPDENGKLVFKEGVLVQAMRNGHWIILDELNLAPTDVLEALNRLLDDNRELFIPEIETTVKAHPLFMLFATQNPPGLYGGRQVLSRAFRNRFVELHFDMIPSKELSVILHRRCDISLSHSEKMIRVLEDLQKMRRDSNIFQGKQSFITLRDLFRWAERYRLAHDPSTKLYDWDQHIADEGYLVLAGRMRLEKEAEEIKKVLEKNMKRKVNPKHLFELSYETSSVTRPILEKLSLVKGFKHIVWTLDMRRLFVLVSKALIFCEPVLLVGETGCGKTTVCQMIAAIKEQNLFTVNCHMHTEGSDFLGGLRPVRDRAATNDNRLFEWVDGPLIQAMKSGGLFLADEISLADDSVLERMNSLLEPERTLVLTEKGCGSEGDQLKKPDFVVAHDLFRLIGTMNPGGDYGKKELSPALRNRLTEIWCPKVEIGRSKNDVLLIIDHNLHLFSLKCNEESISKAMLSFLIYFSKTDLGKKCTISIRDILSWVSFINKVTKDNPDLDVGLAYIHGAYLVLLDSLGSGATGSTVLNWKRMKLAFQNYLCKQACKMTSNYQGIATLSKNSVSSLSVINNNELFGIEPFVIHKGPILQTDLLQFSFKTPKTCLNLLRILRGLQLSRPILLEGSPGVGKTSIVTALAKASGNEIIRINLSEQTDVSDLFGADLPEEGSEGGRFAWRDGPLLQALKSGAWVVLDELNLASQSVLEGLNACFDHRGEVFVPELNKTFEVKHNVTKIFACQNPQYQGGARKGLPKSFLNRFTQVYIEPFTSEDLTFILRAIYSEIPLEIVTKMINFNETLVNEVHEEKLWGNAGGPWEFNLRDLFRWCEIMLKSKSFATLGKLNPGEFVEVIYADRMRKKEDKENVLYLYRKVFGDEYPLYQKSGIFFNNESFIQVGRSFIEKRSNGNNANHQMKTELFIMHNQTPYMESIINCINMNWMTILVGESGEGKTSLVHLLSNLTGKRLETIAVNSHMDVTELLGGFEQADYGRHLSELIDSLEYFILKEVRQYLLGENTTNTSDILQSWKKVVDMKKPRKNLTTSEEVEHYLKVCRSISETIEYLVQRCPASDVLDLKKSCKELIMKVSKSKTVSGGGIFEWVDSSLVKAVRNGHWLLIDGVNLCSPSVLDRLNGLLEPGGVLTINERGIIDGVVPTVTPHPDFRIFLTMDPQYGEISRAMRNRGLEICLTNMWENEMDVCTLMLAHGLKNVIHQKLLIRAHSCVREALPGYEKLSISYLCRAALQMNQLMQLGQTPYNALRQSLNLTYGRNFVKVYRAAVKETIKIFVSEIDKRILKISLSCPPLIKLALGFKLMHNASDAAYPCQIVSLIESFEMTNCKKISAEVLSSLPLPLSFPNSADSLLTALFITLASASLPHWELLSVWATEIAPEQNIVSNVIKIICSSPSNPLMKLKNITNFQLPADPRFNIPIMTINGLDLNHISYLANKALVGLWFSIKKEFKYHDSLNKNKINKKSKTKINMLELSKEICAGTVSSKMCFHSSLNYIYPLIDSLSKLISTLTNDITMPFTDIDYFDFLEAFLWVDRFENICQQVIQKETFHLFLPQLVFHWQKLQDTLFSSKPPIWHDVIPKELVTVNDHLKQNFYSYCSPLHHIVPIFRTNLGGPLPFANETAANFYIELGRVASSLVPYIDKVEDCSINYLLASKVGRRAKCSLIDVVVDSSKEDVDFSELFSQLHDIEENIKLELSKDKLNLDKALTSIQVWPIIDLLVSKQLNFTEAKRSIPKVFINECTEALIKCSQLPIDCINANDPSGRLSAVSVYLYNVNNCSVKRPSRWVFFEESQEDSESTKACDYWKGEDKVVLSSMGCLLTYHLLTGFCKPNQEMEEITVGRHCEREKQLTSIRSTLFRNWNHFTDVNSSYNFSFKESVKKFVSDLFSSLSMTMKIGVETHLFNDYLELLKVAEIVLEKQQQMLGMDGCKLLSLLSKQRQVLEVTNGNDIELTKLGIYAGLFQSWLLAHVEPLDPAQQRNLMLSYHGKEQENLEDSLLIYKWVELLRYNHSEQLCHPHASFYGDKLEKIKIEVKSLSRIIAYRPEPSQYVEIAQKVSDFNNTVFLPSRVLEIINCLETSSGNNLNTIILQCEGMLLSCDNFIKNIFTSYLPYKDLYIPLLHAVSFTCESIRAMMAQRKLHDLCSFSKVDLTSTLTRVLAVPLRRYNDNPSLTVTEIIADQSSIASVLKENLQNKNHCILSQSLLLRCSIYDLYNFAVAEACLEKTVFNHLSSLTAKVIEWWKEQKEEEKRKAEEEASLFKYKARTLAVSETEEEEIEREYKELFPDYDEEFNDLDNIGLDDNMNVEEDDKKIVIEKDIPKLTDGHLQELIECYLLLSTSLTNTSWLSPSLDLEMKTVTPVLLRSQQVQLLLRAVGPVMSQEVDGASIGSFLISNHVASSTLKESINLSLINKPYNYYHDSVPEESLKIKPLLHNLEIKINELLVTWPSHPTLLMINKVIHRVLDFSVTSPLIRFVIGLEAVLEKSHEWEKNAHKGVSLMAVVSPITNQILEWRKKELNAWKSCLDMITFKVSMESHKYWPHLYESFTTIGLDNVDELIESLKQFMEKALIGDYERRLQLMFSFHCHLINSSKYCQNPEKKCVFDKLICVIWNIFKFYEQFLPFVKETITNGMKPIERQVKDFIKIMRWNDINFFAVKDSVIKSRRTLHRHMRNWEKILRQSSEPLLIDIKAGSDIESTGEWDKKEKTVAIKPFSVIFPVDVEVHPVPGAPKNTLIARLPSLTQKCSTFVSEILQNVSYKSNIEAIEEMSEQIIVTYQNLNHETAKAEAISDKDNRMRQLKAIMHHKRECLSTLLKSLNHIGVSYTKGNSIYKVNDRDKCLLVPPLDIRISQGNNKNLENICQLWETCDKYFYRCIGRHSLVFNALNKEVHSDLGPELIKRLKGTSCHFLLLARTLREALPSINTYTSEAILMVNEIKNASKMMFCNVKYISECWSKVSNLVVSLTLTLAEEMKLLETFTEAEPLVVIQPSKTPLSTLQVQETLSLVGETYSELRKIAATVSINNQNFNKEGSYKLASEKNVLELKGVVEKVSSISQNIEHILSLLNVTSHPTSTLSQPLSLWIKSWELVESEFEDWSLELRPISETCYSSSELVEVCVTKILLGVEGLYKSYCNIHNTDEEEKDDTKLMISEGIVNSLRNDINQLKFADINDSILSLISGLRANQNPSMIIAVKEMLPLLYQYIAICENLLAFAVSSSRSINKLLSIILALYQQMTIKGLCRPNELEEQGEGEGATTFEDSGPGLTEGEGQKDVSDRFESEDQLESALREGQKEQAGDKDVDEEEGGIEMSQDFEGKMQNIEKKEDEDQKEDNDDGSDEEELDKEMGETEKGADKIDEKLWGDEEDDKEDEDGPEKEEEDEHGPGDGETTESELVAKDDNKNKKDVDKREEKKKKELEVMEEDLREQNEENDEETYDDKYKDNLGGEDHPENKEEEEQMELPDNLNLDGQEKNEGSGDEDDLDINPEIEEKALFPEDPSEPKEKGDDKDDNSEEGAEKDEEGEDNPNEGASNEEEEIKEGDEDRVDKTRLETEKGDEEEISENANDEATPSQDTEAKEEAQAAETDTKDASKDKTKDLPTTDTGAQPEEDEEFKQDEQGEMGEQTEDMAGVGQSDSKTRDDSHKGQTSALTNEQQAEQNKDEITRPRKPGDVDDTKTLGDVEKEIHQGLMTKKTSGAKEKEEEPSESAKTEDKDPEGKDAQMYEHIGMADDNYDKQTIDAGTQEEAKLRPAPLEEGEEEENKDEPEGIEDTLMDVEEAVEETAMEETKKRQVDSDGKDGPMEKKSRGDAEGLEKTNNQLESEGDIVKEMIVERGPQNEYHTLSDDEDVVAEIFSEEMAAAVRDSIMEADDGDFVTGSDQWVGLEGKITPLALQLCEQLRLILEPTEASKLRGDFRTGKRLNMRKVIPYIASQFRKDKIWLRRTQPSKRSYQVLLAVDDSESMKEMNAGELTRESVSLVAKALALLEVGNVGVLSFGKDTKILHPLHKPFSDQAGAKIFANLKFDQTETNFAKMIRESVALFSDAKELKGVRPEVSQLLLIVSDGQTHKHLKAVKAAVRAAREARVFLVFLVIDALKENSFYDTQVCEFVDNKVKLTSLSETFPFPYFLVVRDLQGLPDVLAAALRQWFELVTADAH